MFTANPELRSFLLWLDVFTLYKKESAGSVHPEWAEQDYWHELQTQTTCAQDTKIIYGWNIAYFCLHCQSWALFSSINFLFLILILKFMLPYHAFSFYVRISFQHTQSCQQSLFVHAPKPAFQTSRSSSFCIQPTFYTICIDSRIA